MTAAHELAPGWAVYNASTKRTDAEVTAWCAAIEKQLAQFCPDYGRAPVAVAFYGDPKAIPPGTPTAAIVDRSDVKDALAYHTQLSTGEVKAVVGDLTCAENGEETSAALSHEILEGDLDPYVNKWCDMRDGKREIAVEVCDPVQDQTYTIDDVVVSSYVLPDYWNDRPMRGARFDRLGALTAPFTRTPGGYFVTRDTDGRTTEEGMRPAHKSPEGRGARRRKPRGGLHGPTLDAVRRQATEHGAAAAQVVYGVIAAAEAAS